MYSLNVPFWVERIVNNVHIPSILLYLLIHFQQYEDNLDCILYEGVAYEKLGYAMLTTLVQIGFHSLLLPHYNFTLFLSKNISIYDEFNNNIHAYT
jgi:hypothetical protein